MTFMADVRSRPRVADAVNGPHAAAADLTESLISASSPVGTSTPRGAAPRILVVGDERLLPRDHPLPTIRRRIKAYARARRGRPSARGRTDCAKRHAAAA